MNVDESFPMCAIGVREIELAGGTGKTMVRNACCSRLWISFVGIDCDLAFRAFQVFG